ncbi:MAG: DUF2061 domain-containing protein [Pseudomonadota bacterium]
MTDMPIDHIPGDSKSADNSRSEERKVAVGKERAWRSFAKALTWRVLGTLDTFILSFFLIKYLGPYFGLSHDTSNVDIAATASLIAITEVVTKIIIYTLHERGWNRVQWGVMKSSKGRHERKLRSLVKMSTWRVLASLDTTLLAWFFTGNFVTALSIGSFEVLTKLVLYYFHERAWLKVRIGLEP